MVEREGKGEMVEELTRSCEIEMREKKRYIQDIQAK